MRVAVALTALGMIACGRIAFDPRDVSDDRSDGGSVDSTIPLSCGGTSTPLGAIPANPDLTATALADGSYVLAWADPTSITEGPSIARLDATFRVAVGPRVVSLVSANAVGALAELGSRLVLHSANGTALTLLAMTPMLDGDAIIAQGPGLLGEACLLSDLNATRDTVVSASGSQLEGYYVQTSAVIGPAPYDTGAPIASLTCSPGNDHVHVGWLSTTGTCGSVDIGLASPTLPTYGAAATVSTDCRQGRASAVNLAGDSDNVKQAVAIQINDATVGAKCRRKILSPHPLNALVDKNSWIGGA
jgi:hypothetical protein